MSRHDGRKPDELRPIKITTQYLTNPAGSCLIEMGKTRVVCSAFLEESVPGWLKGQGKGWLTAEYSMLPGCSSQRVQRERNKVGGRTHEIQRLIGRSLRACVDLKAFGERSLLVDCDVIDADGGTRTASITGAYVAVALALKKLKVTVPTIENALKVSVAAISVGMVNGVACLDLNYEEDKDAEVDMNVVRTSQNRFIEVQGTAENQAFDDGQMEQMITLAKKGIEELFLAQRKVLQG